MITSDIRQKIQNTFLRFAGVITQAELEQRNREIDERQETLKLYSEPVELLGIGAITENRRPS